MTKKVGKLEQLSILALPADTPLVEPEKPESVKPVAGKLTAEKKTKAKPRGDVIAASVISLEKSVRANEMANKQRLNAAPKPLQPTMALFGKINNLLEHLINYSTALVIKFPRDQKWPAGIGCKIMDKVDEAMAVINAIIMYNPSYDRETGLRQLCVLMRTINSYIKVAYQQRYITSQNWQAWVKQTVEIDNLAIRMAMYMQKDRQAKRKKNYCSKK